MYMSACAAAAIQALASAVAAVGMICSSFAFAADSSIPAVTNRIDSRLLRPRYAKQTTRWTPDG